MSLTLKQRRFVEEYLKDGNGTRAARAAGYRGSDPTLSQVSYENLRKTAVRKEISDREESQRVDNGDLADLLTLVLQETTIEVSDFETLSVLADSTTERLRAALRKLRRLP